MRKHTLLIASNNRGKVQEIKTIFVGLPFEVISIRDLGSEADRIDVKETGETFTENAILKAKALGKRTGLLTLADDSGLEIDALRGKPGVRSARFARGPDQTRWKKALRLMRGIATPRRTARFKCVVALYDPKTDETKVFKGKTEGIIAKSAKGSGGFGYDPIFYSEELHKTFGQASPEEKNTVSHRARALRPASEYLRTLLSKTT